MRYINLRFPYLLTNLLTYFHSARQLTGTNARQTDSFLLLTALRYDRLFVIIGKLLRDG